MGPLPLLSRSDLLSLGSADAHHFNPRLQQILARALIAIAIIATDQLGQHSTSIPMVHHDIDQFTTVGRVAPRHEQRTDETLAAFAQLGTIANYCIPPSLDDESGILVAEADDLFAAGDFLLLEDTALASLGHLADGLDIRTHQLEHFFRQQSLTR